jgi:hypothetical protein
MNKFVKIPYEVGKKTVEAIRKMNVKGTANAAMNVGTGVAIASMIPMSTGSSTDKDIDRMKQYQPDGRRQTAADGR